MSAIIFESLIILLLLVINGIFSMSELAMMTARKVRLEHQAERGDAGAAAALALAQRPNNFLATVQVGITLVGVLAGAYGGAGIAQLLAARFAGVPWLAAYAEPAALALVVAAITYFSLIIGELVPKRIALSHPERVASLVARPMALVARAGGPLVSLLTGSTNFVFRLLGIRPTDAAGVTEQDIRAMVEQGAESGVVHLEEHAIVENAFRLGDRQAGSLMTPRPDVNWVDVTATPAELQEHLAECTESRMVVCDESLDDVLGIVHVEDLLTDCLAGRAPDLRRHLWQPNYVPETMPALQLLEEFRRTRQQVAVVLDEFGGVQGIVKLDDIVDAVFGDLPERGGDPPEAEIVAQPDGSWRVDGAVPLEELERMLDLDPLPAESRRGYRTVGGLAMTQLGRLPLEGDRFALADYSAEVVTMEGRRIAQVVLRRSASRAAE